ncbi:MAG: replication-associated recombination protein A [Flavobacteriales bacterium]|nr:replication-associated recombination protein A [Flavobacteriales bacterium]MCB9447883.1 replication-associated recombination protein A [Flavobacteriales bacterium]
MNPNHAPLAERMRPKTLDAYTGQSHLIGADGPLRRIFEAGKIPSMILWGPPGVGKTTLAELLAHQLEMPMYALSAVTSGVKDVRAVIDKAEQEVRMGLPRPVLFIDEIHRFSKAQQDSLLGAVEKGLVTLIGATTENPSFEVISPLLSRCQVYTLNSLGKEDLEGLLRKAIAEDEDLSKRKIELKETGALLQVSGGDGRKLLNALEMVSETLPPDGGVITDELVTKVIQSNLARYDKNGESHYDIISAFIKSIRGSDPNAAVYWMARMIEGGEDPLFIARRLLILASEDIGNANPTALVMAQSCFQAVHAIGYPECRIILSQTATYLASSPKSNASYQAINEAMALVKKTGTLPVPLHLRNAPTQLMKDLGYGKQYEYSHDQPGSFSRQEYLPDEIEGTRMYDPGKNARENELREFLRKRWGDKYGY